MQFKDQLVAIGRKNLIKGVFQGVTAYALEHKGMLLTTSTIACEVFGIAATYRNSPRIHEYLEEYSRNVGYLDKNSSDYERLKKQYLKNTLRKCAPLVAPIIIFFAGSAASAIINNKQHEAKIATLTAALSMAQSTISEYESFKQEAKKELGEEKFKEVEQTVVQKKAEVLPAESYSGIKVEVGDVLCCIPDFNIFFSSTRERIDFAMDRVNSVLRENGRSGRSYGHGSRYGNEVVCYSDILGELNDPQIEIPRLANDIMWEAGEGPGLCNYIRYDTFEGGVTRTGIPYLILTVDLSESTLYRKN